MKLLGVKAHNRDGSDSDFVAFGVEEINYIELDKPTKNASKQPLFHTNHGSYYCILTLEGLSACLQPVGITYLDVVNLVNINNIEYIVETSHYISAYFKNGTSASVSRTNLHKIAHIQRRPPTAQ